MCFFLLAYLLLYVVKVVPACEGAEGAGRAWGVEQLLDWGDTEKGKGRITKHRGGAERRRGQGSATRWGHRTKHGQRKQEAARRQSDMDGTANKSLPPGTRRRQERWCTSTNHSKVMGKRQPIERLDPYESLSWTTEAPRLTVADPRGIVLEEEGAGQGTEGSPVEATGLLECRLMLLLHPGEEAQVPLAAEMLTRQREELCHRLPACTGGRGLELVYSF